MLAVRAAFIRMLSLHLAMTRKHQLVMHWRRAPRIAGCFAEPRVQRSVVPTTAQVRPREPRVVPLRKGGGAREPWRDHALRRPTTMWVWRARRIQIACAADPSWGARLHKANCARRHTLCITLCVSAVATGTDFDANHDLVAPSCATTIDALARAIANCGV